MNWLDGIFIAIVSLSTLIGCFRGLVKEAISLLTWFSALTIASTFTEDLLKADTPVRAVLQTYLQVPFLQYGVAFALLFIITLIIGGLINFIVGRLIAKTNLVLTNRIMGMGFGFLRGTFIVVMIVALVQITPLAQYTIWENAVTVQPVQSVTTKVAELWHEWNPVTTPVVKPES